MFSIELYFDNDLEQFVRQMWIPISEIDINASLNAIEGVSPHISLAVCNSVTSEEIKRVLSTDLNVSTFRIQFDVVGCFPTTGTLFLSPIVSTPLRTIHEKISGILIQLGIRAEPYYLPEYWNPHCTIGLNLHGISMTKEFERTIQTFTPISGWVREIGSIEVVHIGQRHAKSLQVARRRL